MNKAVILWDMKSCVVPVDKHGLHILKRVFHRFCSRCKIQEILAYHDETQVPAVGEPFCFTVQLVACADISQKMEEKIFQLLKDDGIHKLVIITGDRQIADHVSGLQETCSKTFLLIPNRFLNDFLKRPVEWTFDHLTCDLPEDLHKSDDLKRKVVIMVKMKAENQILSKRDDKALTKELQSNIFLRNGFARHPYRLATFQTRTMAIDFRDVMDGSVICGFEIKTYLADEIERDKKENDSSTEKSEDLPVVDAHCKDNLNAPVKSGTSLSEETLEEDEMLDPTIDDRQEQCSLSEGETPNF